MSITNYAELQTTIAKWVNRQDADSLAIIPDFIALVDARLNRSKLSRETIEKIKDDGTGRLDLDLFFFAGGAPNSPIPLSESMVNLRSLSLIGVQDADQPQFFNPPLRAPVIELISPEQLYEHRSFNVTARMPTKAAVFHDHILVSPLPDSFYRWQIVVEVSEPLSDAQPVNSVLTIAPDVYLYGSLVEAASYYKDDKRLPMFEQRFRSAIEALERARSLREWPNTPIARQPRVFT